MFFIPLLALGLDLLLGDPPGRPHPVRLLGKVLDRLEALVRQPAEQSSRTALERESQARMWHSPVSGLAYVCALPGRLLRRLQESTAATGGQGMSPAAMRRVGLCCLSGVALGSYAAVWALCALPWVGWAFSLYFSFAGLSLGQLLREGRAAARLVDAADLPRARQAVSYLVSRDTSALGEDDLRRTLAETVSENFCDGFAAPFFFLCLGGPGLLWLYKAVSTMDSMWGYKTPRYVDLGRAAALADDALAWLPARLSALALVCAGYVQGLGALGAWKHTPAQAALMASPNAGWSMAACAWLVGASMGGPAVYFGKAVEKPRLGPVDGHWSAARLGTLFRLVLAAGLGLAAVLLSAQAARVIFS